MTRQVIVIGRIQDRELVDLVLADQALLESLPTEPIRDPLDRFHDEGNDPYQEPDHE